MESNREKIKLEIQIKELSKIMELLKHAHERLGIRGGKGLQHVPRLDARMKEITRGDRDPTEADLDILEPGIEEDAYSLLEEILAGRQLSELETKLLREIETIEAELGVEGISNSAEEVGIEINKNSNTGDDLKRSDLQILKLSLNMVRELAKNPKDAKKLRETIYDLGKVDIFEIRQLITYFIKQAEWLQNYIKLEVLTHSNYLHVDENSDIRYSNEIVVPSVSVKVAEEPASLPERSLLSTLMEILKKIWLVSPVFLIAYIVATHENGFISNLNAPEWL